MANLKCQVDTHLSVVQTNPISSSKILLLDRKIVKNFPLFTACNEFGEFFTFHATENFDFFSQAFESNAIVSEMCFRRNASQALIELLDAEDALLEFEVDFSCFVEGFENV